MSEWSGWHSCRIFITFLTRISAGRLVALTAFWENSKRVSWNRSEPIVTVSLFIITFHSSVDSTVDITCARCFKPRCTWDAVLLWSRRLNTGHNSPIELITVSTSFLKSWVCFLWGGKYNGWHSCCLWSECFAWSLMIGVIKRKEKCNKEK